MRSTDPDPKPFRPLGDRVEKPKGAAPAPVPIAPGVVRDPDGKYRTNLPLPKGKP